VASSNIGRIGVGTAIRRTKVKYRTRIASNDTSCDTAAAARPLWRALLVAGLAAIGLALAVPAGLAQSGGAAPRAKPPFPFFDLPDRSQGEQAVSRLGNRLKDVADWYGMSASQFTGMMRSDRTVWLDRKGRVFFQEETQLPLQGEVAPLTTEPLSPLLEPYDQTFKLHSRPGAKRTIYLNFVGATLTNTAWNSNGNTITASPFDLDGVPFSFSNAELERIQYIWKRVAESYSPFDVDVTTEPPPADRLTRSSSSDDAFGTTVLITKRDFYSCSCGGVAYLSVFDDVGDYFKPALVFYDALGGGSEKYVADAIAHEAGHNMGLSHDGTSSAGYYTGHGSGATGWAPIMGVGYYQQLVQWSKGEYAAANNTQDDYVVMQNTGLPIRGDDHGDTLGTATAMPSNTANGVTTFTAGGVIERQSDIDFFRFSAGVGSVTVNISPAPRGPMLDVVATLRNSAGAVLATSNPTESLPASLTANITAAGTYYVSVDGVGKGDPLGTGYTDYGSVGQYLVSVTTQATASQPPTAVISATPTSGTAPLTVSFNANGSTDSDGTIVAYSWNFGDGGSQTGVTAQRTYSTAGTYTATLSVTDNAGLTDTKSVAITVQAQTTTYALSVGKSGTGTGTVSSSPAGINCGTTCTSSYSSGTTVTLTATPAAGSTFAGWSGACSGTGACTVSMTAARAVTATFNSVSYTLTVSKGGLGTGTVTSSPAGINCGATCSASYASGTAVTLTATPAAGSTFAGWSGACSGTSSTCTVSMSAASAVTAIFNTVSYTLSATKAGAGSGTVTSSPAGISCGAACSASYASGTTVTLTAAPAAGSTFAGWSGACSGTSSTCTVSMTAARAVTASFDVLKTTSVADIAMSLRKSRSGTDALASVTVRDGNGNLLPGATVSGTWSGAIGGSAALTTDSSGKAAFRSARVKASNGATFTFTVTSIAISGYSYDASKNVETNDSITVGGAQPPTAVLTTDRTSGAAPLTVSFSAAGSSDADGSIVAYKWTFSDGGTLSGATAQRTYSTPGTYTATLTVTDNAGLSASKSVTITAGAPGSVTTVSVADISMSLRNTWLGTEALAVVSVRDSNGNLVPGATVSGTWSGVVSGGVSLFTDSTGKASFRSSSVRAAAGSQFTFTVTGIAIPGLAYDAALNVETSDTITR